MDFSITDGIKFEKDDVCTDVGNKLGDLQRTLDKTFSKGRSLMNGGMSDALGAAAGKISDDIDLTSITDKVDGAKGAFDKLKDGLGGTDAAGEGVANAIECLFGQGADLGDVFKDFNPINMIDGIIDPSVIGKVLDKAASFIGDLAEKAISGLLDPTEKLLSNAISSLEGLLDIKALDKFLQLMQCIENCPGAEGLGGSPEPTNMYEIYCLEEKKKYVVFSQTEPGATGCPNNHFIDQSQTKLLQRNVSSSVIMEQKLSEIGLNMDGTVDWDSDALQGVTIDDSVKNKMSQISEYKKNIGSELAAAKEFSPLPELPAIPEIPKIDNPLNNLDVSKKLEALF